MKNRLPRKLKKSIKKVIVSWRWHYVKKHLRVTDYSRGVIKGKHFENRYRFELDFNINTPLKRWW